jgi:hypothetical protein
MWKLHNVTLENTGASRNFTTNIFVGFSLGHSELCLTYLLRTENKVIEHLDLGSATPTIVRNYIM